MSELNDRLVQLNFEAEVLLMNEKKMKKWKCRYKIKLPKNTNISLAHNSTVWLIYELMTQWYKNSSGLLRLYAKLAQSFLFAASLHCSSPPGHSSRPVTLSFKTGPKPTVDVCQKT